MAFGDTLLSSSLTSWSTPILLVTEFDPEFVNNYELSCKAAFDNGLSINANLFYLDWANMQTRGTELVSTGIFNVGASTVVLMPGASNAGPSWCLRCCAMGRAAAVCSG